MYEISYKKGSQVGRRAVATPYNAEFVKALRATVPSAKFLQIGGDKVWEYDEEFQEDMELVLGEFYTGAQWHELTFSLWKEANVSIDGIDLLWVNRDNWNFAKHTNSIQVKQVSNSLQSGGSRNNPHVSGELVVQVLMRPNAVISPAPETIAVIEQRPANRLAAVPTADLLAEIARRKEAGEVMGD